MAHINEINALNAPNATTVTPAANVETTKTIPAAPTLRDRIKSGEAPSMFMAQDVKPQSAAAASYNADGFSNTKAMGILADAGYKLYSLSSKQANAASVAELNVKKAQVVHLKTQIDGERQAAIAKFVGATTGAVVGAGAGVKAAQLRIGGSEKQGLAGGLDGAAGGGALSNMTSAAVDMGDKLVGGAHKADQAKIQLKVLDVSAAVAAQTKEAMKAAKEMAEKFMDTARQFASDMYQRITDTLNKIANS